MVWAERVASLTPFEFRRRYHITLEGFNEILRDIENAMPRVPANMPKAVPNELKLSMALRWMAGGSYLDIADMHGVSDKTFYQHVWQVIEAVHKSYDLKLLELLKPENVRNGSLEKLAEGFDRKSPNGVMSGCIGALDGLAVKLEKRALKDEGDKGKFYCRKGFYSLNFQVVADADRRILWCSSRTCGSTHDSMALELTELGAILRDVAHPLNNSDYWFAGDDAYKGPANNSDSLLTPYEGRSLDAAHDAFNAWQSKLRIEVECAFGALVHRWGILHRKLSVRPLRHVTTLMSALCKLHNKCMECQMPEHKGRVMSDRYGSAPPPAKGAGGADLFGVDWAEWRLAPKFFDPATRIPAGSRRRQRMRDILRDRLDEVRLRRPATSSYRGYTAGADEAAE